MLASPHKSIMRQDTIPVFWLEDFTLPDSTKSDSGATGWTSTAPFSQAAYGVFNNTFKINNTNSYKGPVVWTSAPIPIAGKTDVRLSVTARSAADVGGWLEYDDSNIYDYELADYIRMYYKVDGGAEVLFGDLHANIKLNCGDTTVFSTAPISGNSVQIIIRGRATAADEYYYFDNVTAAGINTCTANASAAVTSAFTCTTSSVQLLGSSTTSGAVYSWSGPNGFSSAAQSPYITAAGTYKLVVTAPAGCKDSSNVEVVLNTYAPVGLTATVSQQLTCYITSVSLNGSSTTPGVTFSWTGPNGFTAATAQAQVTAGGVYTLHATNTANGCSQTLPLTVSQNIAPPANVTATNSGPLTCDVTEVTLTGTTSSANIGFEWVGPNGYESYAAEDIATDPGNYILTVINFDNGCTISDTTTVAYNCGSERKMTDLTTVASAAATSFEWKVYPNPVNDNAHVEFKLPESNFVTLQVYNNNGIAEKLLFNDKATPNQLYRINVAHGLPAGMHYLIMRVNNKVYTKKIMVVK